MPSLLYSVLTEQIFEGGTSFEDLRKFHDKNALVRDQCSSSVLRSLRLHLYGILLFEKDHAANTVEEWTNDNVNSYLKPVIVQPIKPKGLFYNYLSFVVTFRDQQVLSWMLHRICNLLEHVSLFALSSHLVRLPNE